jgi:vancomycin aglycone glucosyltransferase
MRVLVAAFGTRGDVQPAVLTAKALVAAGHACEVFVPPSSIAWVRGQGLEATAVGLDYAGVARAAAEGRFVDLLRTLPLLRREVDAQVDAMREAAGRCDLVLGCSVFAAGRLLAELNDVPYRFLALSPFLIPSADHPAPFVRAQTLPAWLNRLSWRFNEVLWGAFLKGPLNRRRVEVGLAPARAVWPTLLADVCLLAAEPSLFPLAPQLPPTREVLQTGAVFHDDAGALSEKASTFLSAGEAPVFVGFGSMADPKPQRTAAAIAEGARLAKRRVLVSRGWAGFQLADDEWVCVVDEEPHHLLFPRCAAAVHHGGIGTTHAVARAGLPQAVLPHLLDQFYTAHRLELAGVGFGAPRFGLNGERFAEVLRRLAAPALVERAKEVASGVITDGVQRAVRALVG